MASEAPLEVVKGPTPTPAEFRAVYEEHFSYVWHSVRRLGVASEDLPDKVQDVFAAAYRCWAEFDASRRLRPWLFGIAYRIILMSRRSFARQREAQLALVEPERPRAADDEVALGEARQVMADILATMPEEQRAAFVMHDVDGHGAPEISQALGVPLNTVYSRLRLARRHFNDATARLRAKGEP